MPGINKKWAGCADLDGDVVVDTGGGIVIVDGNLVVIPKESDEEEPLPSPRVHIAGAEVWFEQRRDAVEIIIQNEFDWNVSHHYDEEKEEHRIVIARKPGGDIDDPA